VSRISTTLAATALIVALLGITPLGHAAVDAVRVAVFAQNAGKVGNIKASRTPVPGRLLALDAKGRFPASVLPKGAAGAPGERGERGPQGAQGIPGPAGPQGAGVSYERTIIVSPDPLDETKNGLLLRNALAGLTGNGPTRPYLLKIEPGIYDLGSEPLALKPYVDVEGSGELTTTISSTAAIPATLIATNNSELRFVSVRGTNTVALYSNGVSPRFTHVTATSSGGSFNYPIEVTGGVPLLTDVTTAGTGGAQAAGLVNFGGGSNLIAVNSSFTGSGASSVNVGLLAYGGASAISDSVLTASSGAFAVALRVYNGSHSLANVTASASGATETYGVYSGYKFNAPTVTVNQSRVSGATNSIFAFGGGAAGGAARIGASQLTGPTAALDPSVVTCAASYNGSFAQLSPACS